MIPELGHFALILALSFALIQICIPRLAFSAVFGQCCFLLISFFCLAYSFINNDFSVAYVAENSNSLLPVIYRFCAIWGAHEGSLLLWVVLLSLWSLIFSLYSKSLPIDIRKQTLSILGLISLGFLLFLLLTSNPFLRFLPNYPLDGRDLNPLLQDPGLVSHPPMLYMGYVGFAIPFALAITALLRTELATYWTSWVKPWALTAWCFLSLGIVLGSWWAYRELGWGGWWFWDPVENASFLPWLSGTALIHALILTSRRQVCEAWTVLLAICTFSLSLMGTFLVRSGILVSVHAFASDSARGRFLLLFLALVVTASLILYAKRAHVLQGKNHFAVLSRETLLLANNTLLIIAMLTILLGTLYPLILEAVYGQKISVGFPYFNTVFIPIMLPVLLLMGLVPYCKWGVFNFSSIIKIKYLYYIILSSLLFSLILPWIITGKISSTVVLGLGLALWILLSNLRYFLIFKKHIPMLIAHCGVAIILIGISLSSAYSIHQEVRMRPKDEITVGNYQFYFVDTKEEPGPNYQAIRGDIIIKKNNIFIGHLFPEKRVYTVQNMALSKIAIKMGIFRDLYIALGEQLDNNNTWSLRIYIKPFVRWIWVGGLIMVLGGILAVFSSLSLRKNKTL